MLKQFVYWVKHKIDIFFIRRKHVLIEDGAYIKRPYHIEGGEFIHVGQNVSISAYSKLSCFSKYAGKDYNPTIQIGNNVFANRFLTVLSADKLIIGENTFLGSYVSITNENHGITPGHTSFGLQPLTSEPVVIGNNCWIGDHVTILPGVTIGDWTIIGAGSVVTNSIPSFSIAVGVPARVKKKWDEESQSWKKYVRDDDEKQ